MAWYGSSTASYNQGKSSSNTTTDSTSTTNSNSKTTQGTQLGADTLQGLLQTLSGNLSTTLNNNQYSKENAIADSQDAMNAAIQTALQSGIGGVNQGILNTGAYDSTTRSLLANDLTASAAAQGAKVQQEAINTYAGINNTNQTTALSSLFQALGLDQSQLSDTSATSTTNTKSTSQTSGKSSSFGLSSTGGWK